MNKTQININKNHKNIIMDLEGLYGVMNMFELKNIGPLVKNSNFLILHFMHFLKIVQLAPIITCSIFNI